MTTWTRAAGFLAAAVAASLIPDRARAGDERPRYRIEPGMVLTYRATGDFKYEGGRLLDETATTAWAARRNDDGGVRLVVRKGTRYASVSSGDGREALEKATMDYEFGTFDLGPDGRVGPGADVALRVNPSDLFPRLPADASESKGSWIQADETPGQEMRFTDLRPAPGGWAFRGERLCPENKVYEMSLNRTFHFDAARGLVDRIEDETTQGYGFRGRGVGTTELVRIESRDPAGLAAFAADADRFLAAIAAYSETCAEASRDASKAVAVLADARAALEKARDAVSETAFREDLDRRLKRHESSSRYALDSARRRADVLGKPAADWRFPGLDGKEHGLADYRGKVVVLDFWYRGCGWCVKAMPQMNELVEQYAGKPVAILGMNNDAKEEDAKFVADVMALKYDTIRVAPDFPGKCGVQGFPTVIVLDAEGKVQDLHVGYSTDLREKLTKSIDALLPAR